MQRAVATLVLVSTAYGAALRSRIPVTADGSDSAHMLEDSLMNLLGSDSGNTPELAAFVNQIKSLVEKEMKPKILANKDAQQQSLDQGITRFSQCSDALGTAQSSLASSQANFRTLASDHQKCRVQQGTLSADSQACETQKATLDNVKASACSAFSDFQRSQAATCTMNGGESYRAYAVRLQAFFGAQITAFDQKKKACDDATAAAQAQVALCASKANDLAAQKTSCDQKQDMMDGASCAMGAAAITACSANDARYTQAVASWTTRVATAKAQEAGLKTEWEAVLRLQCLAGVFAAEDSARADAIAACRSADYSKEVARLSLVYPTPPAKGTCSVPAAVAGTPEYRQANYASLPAAAPAKTCTASCCQTTTTTTTTTNNVVFDTNANDLALWAQTNDLGQAQAVATCTALATVHTTQGTGFVFAVTRDCGGPLSCSQVCANAKEPEANGAQKGDLQCLNSLHVYAANSPAAKTGTVGLKTFVYGEGGCGGAYCGPNYCCCYGSYGGNNKPDNRAIQPRLKALVQQAPRWSVMNIYGQVSAQATCSALMAVHTKQGGGWAFAVARDCSSTVTCDQACANAKDQQANSDGGALKCFNTIHLHHANPPSTQTGGAGLKNYVYGEGGCGGAFCGPNYCCCGQGYGGITPDARAIQPRLNFVQSHLQGVMAQSQTPAWSHTGAFAQAEAEATCSALLAMHTRSGSGWAFAVMRQCSSQSPSCAEICAGMTEGQAGKLTCFNSLHVYGNTPFSSSNQAGLKTYIYGGCGGGCGPNFCCCGGGIGAVDSRAIQSRLPKL